MDEQKRQDHDALRSELTRLLLNLNKQIVRYPPNGDDELFLQMIRKAIYYRDLIQRINQELNEND